MVACPFIYQDTYYWEWLGFVIWRLYCRATSGVRGETPVQRRPLHLYYIGRGLLVPH